MKKSNIVKFFIAQILARLCDRMLLVSSIWYMTTYYGKSWLIALLIVSSIPHLICTFFSSRVIHTYSPLLTMVGADCLRAILFLLMFVSCFFEGHYSPYLLLGVFFVVNIAAAFFNPAMFSLPLLLCDASDLQKVMSLVSATTSISSVVGPILGVFFYGIDELTFVFLVAFVGYLIATILETLIKLTRKHFTKENGDGILSFTYIKFVTRYRLIFLLLGGFFLINIFFIPLQLYMPLYTKLIFQADLKNLSIMESLLGFGGLIATIVLYLYHWQASLRLKIVIPYFFMGVAYFLFSISFTPLLAYISLFLLGFFATVGNVCTLNFLQSYPKSGDIPTIMSLVNFSLVASVPLGLLVCSILLNINYIRWQVAIYALSTMLIVICMNFMLKFKKT